MHGCERAERSPTSLPGPTRRCAVFTKGNPRGKAVQARRRPSRHGVLPRSDRPSNRKVARGSGRDVVPCLYSGFAALLRNPLGWRNVVALPQVVPRPRGAHVLPFRGHRCSSAGPRVQERQGLGPRRGDRPLQSRASMPGNSRTARAGGHGPAVVRGSASAREGSSRAVRRVPPCLRRELEATGKPDHSG